MIILILYDIAIYVYCYVLAYHENQFLYPMFTT